MAAVAPTSRLTPLNPDPTMTFDRDTQERLIRLIQPKSAHDKMALYDAIARLRSFPLGSQEERDAIDTIHAIGERASAALG